MDDKYQVFISYRRDGGEFLARNIRDRLTEKGYKVFFDVESLRSGDFNVALLEKIEECVDFVLVLPPHGLDRCVNEGDWVRREIAHALKNGKNVVPITQRGFDWPKPEDLPKELRELPKQNAIFASSEFFDAVIDKLATRMLKSVPKDSETKDEQLKAAAEAGDTGAMCSYGIRLEHGSPTLPTDRKKALEWYRKAAGENDPAGMYNLADVYEQCSEDLTLLIDYGIQQEIREKDPENARAELRQAAADYYRQASELGFLPADYRLGNIAEKNQDYEEAFRRYSKAADAGYAPAQNAAGYYLYNGLLSKADPEAGLRLYKLAADAKYAPAIFNYAKAIEIRDPDESIELLRRITYEVDFIPQAACELGRIYEVTKHDLPNAVIYYRIALEAGVEEAAASLQRCQDRMFRE